MFNEFYHIEEKSSRAVKMDRDRRKKRRNAHGKNAVVKSTRIIPHSATQGLRRYA